MDKRHLYTGLIIAVIAALAMVWWLYGRTVFEPTRTTEVTIAGEVYEVRRYSGVEAEGQRHKNRACFRVDREIVAPPELEPRPAPGPDWLECYNAEFIARMLASDEGAAYVAERDDPEGWDRVIAVLPGRRVYMWHQRQR